MSATLYSTAAALLLLGVAGCGSKDHPAARSLKEARPAAEGADVADKAPAGKEVERKIIYTATLRLQVEDFAQAEERLLGELVETHKGQLELSESEAKPGVPRSGRWRVRIPPDELPAFRKAAVKLGEQEQNRLDSQEVTEEFYDLVEQIKSKEKELESYRRLFDQAKAVPDTIAVKKELDRAQQELDRAKGRFKLLENLTGMTKVDIWLRERGAYLPEESPDFGTSAGRTFAGSLDALGRFARGFALILIALAPWLPVILAAALPLGIWSRRRWRSAAAKQTKAAAAAPVMVAVELPEDAQERHAD